MLSLVAALGAISSSHAAADYSGIKSIAIISAIGDELTISSLGGTIFSRSQNTIAINSWLVDDLISKRSAELLQPRFAIIPLSDERQKFLQVTPNSSPGSLSGALKTLPKAEGVDAYVVILKSSRKNWPWIGQDVTGLALSRNATLGAPEWYRAHTLYAIYVFDARSLQQVDWRIAKSSDKYPLPWPVMQADAALWPTDGRTLKPEQAERLKTMIADLLNDSLQESFRRMKLIP